MLHSRQPILARWSISILAILCHTRARCSQEAYQGATQKPSNGTLYAFKSNY